MRTPGPLRMVLTAGLIAWLMVKAVAWMSPAAPPGAPTGAGAIAGTVVDDAGQPIPEAPVVITGGPTSRQVRSDGAGRFEFGALPDAQYTLDASQRGFFRGSYAAGNTAWGPTIIDISGGTRVGGLQVRLIREASIAGTITDSKGQPLPGYVVRAMRRIDDLAVSGTALTTDAAGRFAFTLLQPGEYVVRAGPTGGEDNAQLYFPAALNPSGARSFVLAPGEHRDDIHLKVPPVPTTTISGTVRTRGGGPLPSATVALLDARSSTIGFSPRSVRIDARGAFKLTAIPPGSYTLVTEAETRAGAVGANYAGSVAVETDGRFPVQVTVIVDRGETVSGRVFENDAPAPGVVLRLQGVKAPHTVRLVPFRLTARSGEDGTFQFEDVPPGRYVVFSVSDRSVQWTRHDGRKTMSEFIDVPAGGLRSLDVGFATAAAHLEGVVRRTDGTPESAAVVVVFPVDATAVLSPSRSFRMARPSTSGRYSLDKLPAGEFAVVAVPDLHVVPWRDQAQIDRLRTLATRVTITLNRRHSLDLIVRQ